MLGPPGAHLGFRPPSGALAWVSRSALATQGPRVTLSPWPCPQKQLGTSRLDEATPRQLPRPLGVMSLPPGLQWVGQVGAVGQVSRGRLAGAGRSWARGTVHMGGEPRLVPGARPCGSSSCMSVGWS